MEKESKRKNGIEIRKEVRKRILRLLWPEKTGDGKNKKINSMEFRKYVERSGHRRETIYQELRTLIKVGIVARKGREYVLVPGYFKRKSDLLKYVEFLKSDDPSLNQTGAMGLNEIYSSNSNIRLENFEVFLQSSDIKALIEGQDVSEIIKIREIWDVFIIVLNHTEKYDWLIDRYLISTIQNAVRIGKKLEKQETSFCLDGNLKEALMRAVGKAILDLTASEAYVMNKRSVVKLTKLLRDLDDSNIVQIGIIEQLLKRPCRKTQFSKLDDSLPTPEFASKEHEYEDIWHEPWGYSDLSKEIYLTLKKLGKEKMKALLDDWMAQDNLNLRYGAWIFRKRLSTHKNWD